MLEALLRIVFQVRIHSLTDCFFGNPQPLARSVSEQTDGMNVGETSVGSICGITIARESPQQVSCFSFLTNTFLLRGKKAVNCAST